LEQHQITSIENVDNEIIQTYLEYLKHRKNIRRKGFISNTSLNSRIYVLEQFSQYLCKEFSLIIPIKIKRLAVQNRQRDILTQAEMETLYQATESDYLGIRDRATLSLFYGCGLRSSEGIRLDLNDILFERKLIHVRRTKNRRDRLVPMTETVKNDLQNYLLYSRPYLHKKQTGNHFLVSRRGHRPNGDGLRYRLLKLMETANIELSGRAIGLHSLRHSIATHFLQKGMKLEDIRQFLGHLSLESTQIYTHIAHEIQ
jgi:integrase/recombinase XerD